MRLLIYDTEMQTANAYLPQAIAVAARKLLGVSNVHVCSHDDVIKHAASGAWDGLLNWRRRIRSSHHVCTT